MKLNLRFYLPGLLFILLIFPNSVKSQTQKKEYKSLLWEITGNGISRPSYLYGTMHVSGKIAFNLSDSFFLALKSTDHIALEQNFGNVLHDMTTSNIMKSLMSVQKEMIGNTNGFYTRLLSISEITSPQLISFLRQRSDLVNGLLYRTESNRENFEEDSYLDLFLYQAGKKLNKNIIGLENFDTTMQRYIDGAWEEQQNRDNNNNFTRSMESGLYQKKIQEAYRNGDLGTLDSLMQKVESKYSYNHMIIKRNQDMAKVLDSLYKSGKSIFTGVGAGHLGGEDGMIEILRKAGYTVKPVTWRALRPSKYKSEIDKLKYSVPFTEHYSADSAFSVESPDEIYNLSIWGNANIHLSADLVNGGYFIITNVDHNSFIGNHNLTYLNQRIDSLLYENIAGEIQSKKSYVNKEGKQVIDIVSKTRRGDIEKYRILLNNFGIVMLKAGGNRSYAKGKEIDRFFESYKPRSYNFANSQETPRGFTYKPAFKSVNWFTSFNSRGQYRVISLDPETNKFDLMQVSYLKNYNTLEDDSFELAYAIQSMAEEKEYKVGRMELSKDLKSGVFTWTRENYPSLNGKLTISGNRFYLQVSNEENPNFDNRLNITGNFTYKPFETYTDTTWKYVVRLQDLPEKEGFQSLMNYQYRHKNNKEDDFETTSFNKEFRSEATGERVHLHGIKYGKYFEFTNFDSLCSKFCKEDNTRFMHVENRKNSVSNGTNICDYIVTSPGNNNRNIKVRIVQKGRYVFELRAVYDKHNGSGAFIDTVFTSLILTDTAKTDLFSPKTSFILQNICSKDSAVKAGALAIAGQGYLDPAPSDFNKITQLVTGKAGVELELDQKENLIESLGSIKNITTTNWLKSYYKNVSDTPDLQFAVLRALANQKTLASFSAIPELLKSETPMDENIYRFVGIVNSMLDSHELAIKVLPGMMFLTEFEEYKPKLFSFIADLVRLYDLKPEAYLSKKSLIINDASIALRKHIASLQGDDNENEYDSYDYENYEVPDFDRDEYKSLTKDSGVYCFGDIELCDYAILLKPFYKEPNVKAFFDKLLKNGEKSLQVSVGAYLLKNGISIPESNWQTWAADYETRLNTIVLLNNQNKLKLLPPSILSIDSVAFTEVKRSYLKNKEVDSITLVYKDVQTSKNGTGNLFVYKTTFKSGGKFSYKILYLKEEPGFDVKVWYTDSHSAEEEPEMQSFLNKIKHNIRILERSNCESKNLGGERGYGSFLPQNIFGED